MNDFRPFYEELERFSKTVHRPVATLARNFLYAGIEDARVLNRLGLMKVIGFVRGYSKNVNDGNYWSRIIGDDIEEYLHIDESEDEKTT